MCAWSDECALCPAAVPDFSNVDPAAACVRTSTIPPRGCVSATRLIRLGRLGPCGEEEADGESRAEGHVSLRSWVRAYVHVACAAQTAANPATAIDSA